MRRRPVVLCAAVVALAFAAAAAATIVPQRGVGGVTLGMKPARVRAILGKPVKIRRANNDFGPYMIYRYNGIAVTFQGNIKATSIETSSKKQRTASGVGVGSSESAVHAGVPGVKCKTEGGIRHCFIGQFLPGKRVTDFFLKKGVVSRVVIGFVID
jgi:hypothetical protein